MIELFNKFPREKANDLIQSAFNLMPISNTTQPKIDLLTSKFLARIVVNEILKQPYTVGKTLDESALIKKYWEEVLIELDKIV